MNYIKKHYKLFIIIIVIIIIIYNIKPTKQINTKQIDKITIIDSIDNDKILYLNKKKQDVYEKVNNYTDDDNIKWFDSIFTRND